MKTKDLFESCRQLFNSFRQCHIKSFFNKSKTVSKANLYDSRINKTPKAFKCGHDIYQKEKKCLRITNKCQQ